MTDARTSQAGQPVRWQIGLIAVCLPPLLLVLADLGLRAANLVAPEDPLLFFARSHAPAFSPFVESPDGWVTIRSEWVNPGNSLHGITGTRKGRQFLYPGFRSARFAREKPENAVRIFALGGSSTFGLYVGAEAAFPAVIEERLRDRMPERAVEVIDLGCPGWASDRVVNVLPAVFAQQPDLLIVYSGHNEMLEGHVGVGSGLGFANRLRARLLATSTIFGWLHHAIASTIRSRETEMMREEAAAIEAGHILTYEPRLVPASERTPPGEDFFRRAEVRYEESLRAMVAAARAEAVPLLLVLPVANLLFPPALSSHGKDFQAVDEFRRSMEEATALRARRRLEQALPLLRRAVELSPRHAMAHYELGRVLLGLGREGEALRAFQRASDLDLRTHRITAALEEVLIRVALETGVEWVDLRPAFRAELGVDAARRLFVDHLHPTALGHQIIAEQLLPAVTALLRVEDRAP